MTIIRALNAGMKGEKLSRTITGTSEVSADRSAIAVGSGAVLGGVTASAVTSGATAAGMTLLATATAPVVIPTAIASGVIAGILSLWD